VLIKGLPEDAAVWREERRRFAESPDGKAQVSHAWLTVFRPFVKEKIVTDPGEIGRFFAQHVR
jgi:hypothetical protein